MIDTLSLEKIFEKYPQVKLAYFFGSRASDVFGLMSDYDFAIYLNPFNKNNLLEIKARLLADISKYLQTDNVDLVILNTTQSPDLKYEIISKGKLIYEKEPARVIVEPAILNEYFDFNLSLKNFGLTAS